MFFEFLIWDHVGKPIRKRGITETPLLLLEFEVGVHGEVKGIKPTWRIHELNSEKYIWNRR